MSSIGRTAAQGLFAENLLPFQRAASGQSGAQSGDEVGGMFGAAAHCCATRVAASSGRPISSHNAAKK